MGPANVEIPTFPGNVEKEVRQALVDTDMEGVKLDAAMDLARNLYAPLAEAHVDSHSKQVAIWCRMTSTKTLSDVLVKIERLSAFLELDDDQTERLRFAISTCLNRPSKDQAIKSPNPTRSVFVDTTAHVPSSEQAPVVSGLTYEERIDPEDGQTVTIDKLKKKYAGQYSDAEIIAYFKDDCKTVGCAESARTCEPVSTPPQRQTYATAVGAEEQSSTSSAMAFNRCPVVGLDDWLWSLHLQQHLPKIVSWCVEMGAITLAEVKENWQDVAEEVPMKPFERIRFKRVPLPCRFPNRLLNM